MKILFPGILALSLSFFFGCKNNSSSENNNTAARMDSARIADSTKMANEAINEREAYRTHVQNQIDSLDARMKEKDSIYDKKSEKERQRYLAERSRLSERMDRLRRKKEDINSVAKDDWGKFKMQMDTAMTNLKTDWNNMMEKMKAK